MQDALAELYDTKDWDVDKEPVGRRNRRPPPEPPDLLVFSRKNNLRCIPSSLDQLESSADVIYGFLNWLISSPIFIRFRVRLFTSSARVIFRVLYSARAKRRALCSFIVAHWRKEEEKARRTLQTKLYRHARTKVDQTRQQMATYVSLHISDDIKLEVAKRLYQRKLNTFRRKLQEHSSNVQSLKNEEVHLLCCLHRYQLGLPLSPSDADLDEETLRKKIEKIPEQKAILEEQKPKFAFNPFSITLQELIKMATEPSPEIPTETQERKVRGDYQFPGINNEPPIHLGTSLRLRSTLSPAADGDLSLSRSKLVVAAINVPPPVKINKGNLRSSSAPHSPRSSTLPKTNILTGFPNSAPTRITVNTRSSKLSPNTSSRLPALPMSPPQRNGQIWDRGFT
eukprot:NODE_2304_length_1621_cov_48.987316_g1976_i0.p1 GENE.NODE_2304_length_1621_cov_48.987316_g1976_i0~~NODE_2304_length_1621_cov_48.987316_g1976_i0.p1  ORF type:complete len:397 (-),score=47.51 NODE_2304_length_1621_cov_48.987316_g1976_i0:354-1544(-)